MICGGINLNLKLLSNSPENTLNIAKKIASFLTVGDVIILTGELGSGKTKFVEEINKAGSEAVEIAKGNLG